MPLAQVLAMRPAAAVSLAAERAPRQPAAERARKAAAQWAAAAPAKALAA
ncbi:MAG: hypothetical protein ABSB23_07730 [Bryobacteraceae bacterium]|jgi:hypothetical protein